MHLKRGRQAPPRTRTDLVEQSLFTLRPIGRVESQLRERADAPRQPQHGAPEAWLEFDPQVEAGLSDLSVGEEILLLTWLHRAERDTLRVRPGSDPLAEVRGVFSTRSPDRPNPIGVHRVRIVEVEGPNRFRVDALEAIDGTPIVDVKPVLDRMCER